MAEAGSPKLAPPGAGLPFFQRIVLRYLVFPRYSRKMTWERSQRFFEKEGRRILEIAARLRPEDVNRRVLVKPMTGIEDSSRFWSVAMVMEHLTIVGGQIADGLVDLTHGRVPDKKADTAAVKPFENARSDVILPRYRDFLKDFERRTTEEMGDRDAGLKFLHPWFGRLNPRQWMALAAVHQMIHRKQAEEIAKAFLADPSPRP